MKKISTLYFIFTFNIFFIFTPVFLITSVSHAISLSQGDIIVADGEVGIIHVDPSTGFQTVISSGGLLYYPSDIAIDENKNVFVVNSISGVSAPTDLGGGSILCIDPESGKQIIISKNGNFRTISGISIEHSGNLLVVSHYSLNSKDTGSVIRIDPLTGNQTIITQDGYLEQPMGLAIEADGNILVVDNHHGQPDVGGVIRVDPNTGSQEILSTGFDCRAITIETNGDILVADSKGFPSAGRILRINPITGEKTVVFEGKSIIGPQGIDITNYGQIVVTNFENKIIMIDPVTGNQTTISQGGNFSSIQGIAVIPIGTTDNDADGYSEKQGDCDDNDNSIYPGATEICGDGIDQDCDGTTDEDCTPGEDDDGDGYTENEGDCNDKDVTIYPGAEEVCGDGIDQDCDGKDKECSDGGGGDGGGCFVKSLL